MDWESSTPAPGVTEWERSDGTATVRVRERADGRYAVRLDRLTQAPDGSAYRYALVGDRETALATAAEWRSAVDERGGTGAAPDG